MKQIINFMIVFGLALATCTVASQTQGPKVRDCNINNAPDPAESESLNQMPVQLSTGTHDIFISDGLTHSMEITGTTRLRTIHVTNGSKLKIINFNSNDLLSLENILIDGNSRVYIGSKGEISFISDITHMNPVTAQHEIISITNESRLLILSWDKVGLWGPVSEDQNVRVGIQANSSFRVYSCNDIVTGYIDFYTGKCFSNFDACDGTEEPDDNGQDRSELKLIAKNTIGYEATHIHRRNKSMSISAAQYHVSPRAYHGKSSKDWRYPYPGGAGPEVHRKVYGKSISLEDYVSSVASVLDGDFAQGVYMVYSNLYSSLNEANKHACPDLCNENSVAWNYRVSGDNLYPAALPLLDTNEENAKAYTRSTLNEDKVLQLHPNPASSGEELTMDIVNLNLVQEETDLVVQIFDISGKIVKEYNFEKLNKRSSITFDLPTNIQKGMYLVSFIAERKNYISRLVVQ